MTDSPGWVSLGRSVTDALGTAGLRRLQLAWTICAIGSWIFFIALAVYAYDVGGTAAVGLAAVVRMIPAGLAAPLGGLVADRYSRRDVLLWVSVGRTAVLAGVTAAVALDGPLALVLVLAALDTTIAGTRRPAQAALLPWLAATPRQLAASNALASAIDNAAFLVGSLLAGTLIAAASTEAAFGATAALFAAAVVPVAIIQRDPVPEYRAGGGEEGPLQEVASGFQTVAANRGLRLVVLLLAASTLIEGAVDVLVVVVAIQLLDLGGAGVGWLNSAWGVGGLVGGAAALSLLTRGRLASGLAFGALLIGVPLAAMALLTELAVALLMLVALGVGYALVEIAGNTLLQRLTSDEVLARAFAVVESSYWLTTGIGAMLAPLLVSLLGPRGALLLLGALLPVLVALRWAPLARLEAGARVPERTFRLLRDVTVFAPLPLATVEDLSRRVTELRISPGEIVIREGDTGDHFYVIADGILDVSQGTASLSTMEGGEFFGEIALLRDVPRTATVTARTHGLLYALEREVFITAVTGHRYTSRTVESVAAARLAAG
jgi:MFS family permease